jgi:mercuric ion transport protein
MRARGATLAGSVVSGIFASACCLGPLVLSLLGISGAAVARRFEPLRPYLLVLTYGLLAGAFYLSYRPAKAACAPGGSCAMPRASRAGNIALWVALMVVLLTTLFPLYSVYLF